MCWQSCTAADNHSTFQRPCRLMLRLLLLLPWMELLMSTAARGCGTAASRQLQYAGPYLVLEKGPKVFKLLVGTKEEVITRDRLKPHVGLAPLAVAE